MRADKSTVVRTIITMPLDDTVPFIWISVALVAKAGISLRQIDEILEVQQFLALLYMMRIKALLAGPNAEVAMVNLRKDWSKWGGGARGWWRVWAPALDIAARTARDVKADKYLTKILEGAKTVEESKGEIVSGVDEEPVIEAASLTYSRSPRAGPRILRRRRRQSLRR